MQAPSRVQIFVSNRDPSGSYCFCCLILNPLCLVEKLAYADSWCVFTRQKPANRTEQTYAWTDWVGAIQIKINFGPGSHAPFSKSTPFIPCSIWISRDVPRQIYIITFASIKRKKGKVPVDLCWEDLLTFSFRNDFINMNFAWPLLCIEKISFHSSYYHKLHWKMILQFETCNLLYHSRHNKSMA